MMEKSPPIEERMLQVESQIGQLAEALANHAHYMHLMARQIRLMANEIDADIEPPRMN